MQPFALRSKSVKLVVAVRGSVRVCHHITCVKFGIHSVAVARPYRYILCSFFGEELQSSSVPQ